MRITVVPPSAKNATNFNKVVTQTSRSGLLWYERFRGEPKTSVEILLVESFVGYFSLKYSENELINFLYAVYLGLGYPFV